MGKTLKNNTKWSYQEILELNWCQKQAENQFPKNYLNRQDMEECGHVLKQFIKSDSMNSEECKTECSDKKLT